PTAAEAAGWVRGQPGDADYRLALARALVREGRPDLARAQYDTLLLRAPTLALLREAAGAYAEAHDSLGAARLLGEAVAQAPADTALRRDHARALAWSGDRPGAIREYSVLIEQSPDPDLLSARGQLHLLSGDRRRAEADYREALRRRPGDATALAGLEAARREARWPRARDEEEGFASTTRFVSDNAGFDFVATALSAGVGLGEQNRTVLFASGDVRRVSRDTAGFAGARHVDGFWVQGGVAQWLGRFRVSGRAGLLHHSDVPDIGTWAFQGELVRPDIRAGVAVSRSAAYETLRAGRTLGPAVAPGVDPALRATALSATVSLPFANGADLWASAEHLWLTDSNDRTSVGLALRYPLVGSLSAVYSGGGLGFGDLAPLYWSPRRYVLQALGLEYRIQRSSGLTLALRGLPGVAFLSERTVPGGPAASRSVFQWSATVDLAYRRPRWELGAFAAYGRDRSDAGYAAGSGLFRLRWYW
ncbi:MAG: tetratricopeptide repeat protein, partial [Deltaproteobacteria bacterium]